MYRTIVRLSVLAGTLLYAQKLTDNVRLPDVTAPLPQVIEGLNDQYAQRRCISLQRLIKDNTTLNETAKLACVNTFFNQIPYRSDRGTWGRSDYWASPLETLVKGAADCEDYAIAKFYTLLRLGVAPEKLYLAYVRVGDDKTPHFVLTYYASQDAVPLVLDNRTPEIRPAVFDEHFEPVYRFNLNTFVAYRDGKAYRSTPMDRMKFRKWQDLNRRIRRL